MLERAENFMNTLRSLSWLMALVFAMGFFVSAAHHILTPHDVCALHGEVVHGGHAPVWSGGLGDEGAQPGDLLAPLEGGQDDHDCDHCTLGTPQRAACEVATGPGASPALDNHAPVLASLTDGWHRSHLLLYLLAPKNSPPA